MQDSTSYTLLKSGFFSSAKYSVMWKKKWALDSEEIFAIHVLDKGLVSRIYQELSKFNHIKQIIRKS